MESSLGDRTSGRRNILFHNTFVLRQTLVLAVHVTGDKMSYLTVQYNLLCEILREGPGQWRNILLLARWAAQ